MYTNKDNFKQLSKWYSVSIAHSFVLIPFINENANFHVSVEPNQEWMFIPHYLMLQYFEPANFHKSFLESYNLRNKSAFNANISISTASFSISSLLISLESVNTFKSDLNGYEMYTIISSIF